MRPFLQIVFYILVLFTSKGYCQSLQSLGNGVTLLGTVYAMQYDSANNKLYVGGDFESIEGVIVNNIAMWDGVSWHSLSSGISGIVLTMKLVGSDLYVGGYFHSAGGVTVSNVAKWDGISWTGLGQGLTYVVNQMEYFQNKIYITGYVPYTSNYFLASFDGVTWNSNLGKFDGNTNGILVKDTGLVVYGGFRHFNADSVTGIINYDGLNAHYYPGVFRYGISSMATINNKLYALSYFGDSICSWNNTSWATDYVNTNPQFEIKSIFNRHDSLYLLSDSGGISPSSVNYYTISKIHFGQVSSTMMRMRWNYRLNMSVNDIIASGDEMFLGGMFNRCGDTLAISLLHYNGAVWSNPGKPCSNYSYKDSWNNCSVSSIVKDSSSGDIYAAGTFYFAGGIFSPNVSRWDGAAWNTVGKGLSSSVTKLIYYQNELYAFGYFGRSGTQIVNYMAKWDGTSWIPAGNTGADGPIYDAVVYNNELYICGDFEFVNGISTNYVAKYDGISWSAAGDNVLDRRVYSLAVFNGKLIAAPEYNFWFGFDITSTAFLDSTDIWQKMGPAVSPGIASVIVYNNELYGAGSQYPGAHIYKWTGTNWILNTIAGGPWDSGRFLLFNNQLCLTIPNNGFFMYDGSNFNRISQIHPYAILEDTNVTYIGGFIPRVMYGLRNDTINDIGTLTFTLPQVSISSNTDTICERQYVFYESLTSDVFAKLFWHFPGGSPDTLSVYNPIIQYNTPGTYPVYLVATNFFGTDTISLPYNIHVRGCILDVDNLDANNQIIAYPNPFSNILFIKSTRPSLNVRIVDITGKVIFHQERYGLNEIDVSEFSNGIYFINFTSENINQTFKMIKQ